MSKIQEKDNKQQINFSRQGVQISYRRFLSDSAGGFLFIGSIFALVKLEVAPFNYIDLSNVEELSREAKAFFLLLVFLLATPIGLIINAVSWFAFGSFDLRILQSITKNNRFLSKGTKSIYRYKRLESFFKLDNSNGEILDKILEIKGIIDFYYPQLSRETDISSGARRLIRSFNLICLILIFILIIGIVISPTTYCPNIILIAIVVSIVFLFWIIQPQLRFYDLLHTLNNAYMICLPKKDELKDFDSIKKHLIEVHSKMENNIEEVTSK